ncbi:hypothetical protein GL263_21410 [Streptomyces durbertensis]|uniref:Uncharacterized protein n=1 Tax=Streptomyces durbertensis TaxID=2448886 RepID=A0ABR6EL73_9ACTN|nr:hypothetical protein [Streptomyces durbertensis]MBB1246091.1 hypothetical protein [Streptomyces durbertensis]
MGVGVGVDEGARGARRGRAAVWPTLAALVAVLLGLGQSAHAASPALWEAAHAAAVTAGPSADGTHGSGSTHDNGVPRRDVPGGGVEQVADVASPGATLPPLPREPHPAGGVLPARAAPPHPAAVGWPRPERPASATAGAPSALPDGRAPPTTPGR